ncbi:MAG: cyclophilin-like fold protein [Lachnospiraceae bacterium]
MKKLVAMVCMVSMLFSLAACGVQIEGAEKETELSVAAGEENTQPVLAEEGENQTGTGTGQGNILIAYFTWADNTVVEDAEAAIQSALSHYDSVGDTADYSGVDATSSASVLPPGNTAQMAEWIQQRVGGDLFSIVAAEPYPSDYDACMDRAADEKAENARPELAEHIDNMDDYDIVFLGFPNWWYTAPMAVFSFIEEYDFSGKTVIPFCAHGTGGLAASVRDITEALPDSVEILEPIGIFRGDMDTAQTEIDNWIDSLGIDLSAAQNTEETEVEDSRKIRFVLDDGEMIVGLYENSASDDLLGRLPMTVGFEDYNGTEKISYLDAELDLSNAPGECTPQTGDLTYYAPWGNLAFFYHDFRNSPQLIPLGRIETGGEYLENLDSYTEVTIERYAD